MLRTSPRANGCGPQVTSATRMPRPKHVPKAGCADGTTARLRTTRASGSSRRPTAPSARDGFRGGLVDDLQRLHDLREVAGAGVALAAVDQLRILLRADRLRLPAA